MNVKAKRVDGYDEAKNPGDFFFSAPNPQEDGMMRLSFLCPCGCGDLCGVRIREDGQQDGNAWGWNKDRDAPTCTPSIAINGNHWHGYLKAGVFEPC